MTLVLSLIVIIGVAALVGRLVSRSRPGARHARDVWPGALDAVDLTDLSRPHDAHPAGGWNTVGWNTVGGNTVGGGDGGGGGGGDGGGGC
ncbi:hypothetical protein GTR02_06380 [Kineococcus sp. R8]|uniref:hypothetical protein n=1 Tax=Kineococcus siccus TaxID=2696567 RepID=UPI001412E16E|nr:hypothetical protein [Kineococcus siccus]NAZ81440.1 hypothetical protein [Kineococcus siccus]